MATYEARKVGPNEFSFPGFPIQVQVVKYDYEDFDAGRKVYVPIDAGLTVLGVGHLTTDTFHGGTGATLKLSLGDSSSPTLWHGGTDMSVIGRFEGGVGAPKHYATANYALVTSADSKLYGGEGEIFVFYVDTRTNWRTENDL